MYQMVYITIPSISLYPVLHYIQYFTISSTSLYPVLHYIQYFTISSTSLYPVLHYIQQTSLQSDSSFTTFYKILYTKLLFLVKLFKNTDNSFYHPNFKVIFIKLETYPNFQIIQFSEAIYLYYEGQQLQLQSQSTSFISKSKRCPEVYCLWCQSI